MTVDDERLQRLEQPHVAPLTALVRGLRERGLSVPNVDPNDGGIEARVLVLLESPGPKAVGSTFISRDNPDPSARNIGRAIEEAGLSRRDTVLWNVVPHCVSTVDENRNASIADIAASAPDTQAFIDLLPRLKAVVFCGRRAQHAIKLVRVRDGVRVFATAHPGAMAYNRQPLREHLHQTFREARSASAQPRPTPRVTDEEGALLRFIYAEARGRVENWVPLMELPSAALVLAKEGFITILDGPDLQHVALTESGRVLAAQLAAK